MFAEEAARNEEDICVKEFGPKKLPCKGNVWSYVGILFAWAFELNYFHYSNYDLFAAFFMVHSGPIRAD